MGSTLIIWLLHMPYQPNYQALESILAKVRDSGGDVARARALFRELIDLVSQHYGKGRRMLTPEAAYQAGKLASELREMGLTMGEIAEVLNVPPTSVKSWVQRYRRYVAAKQVAEEMGEVMGTVSIMGSRTLKALGEILQRLVAHEMAYYIGLGKGAFDALRGSERIEIPVNVDEAVVEGYRTGHRLVEELLERRMREAEVSARAELVETITRDLTRILEAVNQVSESLARLSRQLVEEAAAALTMRAMVSPARLVDAAQKIDEALARLRDAASLLRPIAESRTRGS